MNRNLLTLRKITSCIGAVVFLLPCLAFLAYWVLGIPNISGFQRQLHYRELMLPICGLWIAVFSVLHWINWRNPEIKMQRTVRQAVLASLGGLMFAYIFTVLSVPVLAYWAHGTQVSSETSVMKIERGSRRSRCNTEIWTELDPGMFSVLCVSSEAANLLKPGDRILLSGRENAVALFVEEIELIKRP